MKKKTNKIMKYFFFFLLSFEMSTKRNRTNMLLHKWYCHWSRILHVGYDYSRDGKPKKEKKR
jgi:hypothetical protein